MSDSEKAREIAQDFLFPSVHPNVYADWMKRNVDKLTVILLRRAIEEMELIRDGFQALAHVDFVRWLKNHEAALKAELEKLEGS